MPGFVFEEKPVQPDVGVEYEAVLPIVLES